MNGLKQKLYRLFFGAMALPLFGDDHYLFMTRVGCLVSFVNRNGITTLILSIGYFLLYFHRGIELFSFFGGIVSTK